MIRSDLYAINRARKTRIPVALVWQRGSSEHARFLPENEWGQHDLPHAVSEFLTAGKSGWVTPGSEGSVTWFVRIYTPAVRIIMIGAVHIAQHLAPMARQCGFDVLIIDPRPAFANTERFPGEDLIAEWPDNVLSSTDIDPQTAVVLLTHDPKIDDVAARIALMASGFYIGALGSRKTHSRRLDRLAGTGIAPRALANIRGPVGLDIGASSPAEIAVAILGQIIATLRKRSA